MNLLLAVLILCQVEEHTVDRLEAKDYNPAIKLYTDAVGLLETDPAGAIEKIDSIMSNPKIKKSECILRIQIRVGDTSEPIEFFPLQIRGRARMNRALAEPVNAEKMLAEAVEDLQKSADKKIDSSAAYLKEAQARLLKLRTPVLKGAYESLRDHVNDLIAERKFAMAMTQAAGAEGITPGERKAIQARIHDKCREYTASRVVALKSSLGQFRTLKEIYELELQAFSEHFTIPAAAELVTPALVLDWARDIAAALQEMRTKDQFSHVNLLRLMQKSVPLETRGENPWFKWIEQVSFEQFQNNLVATALEAPGASGKRLRQLEIGAAVLVTEWKKMEESLDSEFRARHRFLRDHTTALVQLSDSFPKHLDELDGYRLAACLESDQPEEMLQAFEKGLNELATRKRVTLDSRQRLCSLLAKAGALRLLLEGKSVEDVAARLQNELSGKFEKIEILDLDELGPRVRKVLEALKAPR